ncbi:MAG: hypothetical protein LBK04_00910 [Clostridiales Family XIII bacterium]|jgi:hypothetical protein|nr:hypothetical protein [Clostridiales Family XIII bacterium]
MKTLRRQSPGEFARWVSRDTSGSAMVESAIILPIVILAVMAVLYLHINLYTSVCLSSHIHLLLRQEVAEEDDLIDVRIDDAYVRDRYRREAEGASITVLQGRRFAAKYLEAEKEKKYFGGMLANPSGYSSYYYGRSYIIDEAGIARALSAASAVL